MSYGIKLHVWGDYACFTRPELKAERMTYEVMTPSAARGILTAIYWKPEFRWVVDRIGVLNPIEFGQIRRNEVGNKVSPPSAAAMRGEAAAKVGLFIEDTRQQRAMTYLRRVSYVIEAHVELLHEQEGINNVAKHLEMFKRRAANGQCFHQPCLGMREFFASFALVDASHPAPPCQLPPEQRNRNLGLMLHDMVYTDDRKGTVICAHTNKKQSVTPKFFMAELCDGVLTVPPLNQALS
ncbi:MAG: type I-C CRISPR-associated protein Cas5c [Akkermansia sp.]